MTTDLRYNNVTLQSWQTMFVLKSKNKKTAEAFGDPYNERKRSAAVRDHVPFDREVTPADFDHYEVELIMSLLELPRNFETGVTLGSGSAVDILIGKQEDGVSRCHLVFQFTPDAQLMMWVKGRAGAYLDYWYNGEHTGYFSDDPERALSLPPGFSVRVSIVRETEFMIEVPNVKRNGEGFSRCLADYHARGRAQLPNFGDLLLETGLSTVIPSPPAVDDEQSPARPLRGLGVPDNSSLPPPGRKVREDLTGTRYHVGGPLDPDEEGSRSRGQLFALIHRRTSRTFAGRAIRDRVKAEVLEQLRCYHIAPIVDIWPHGGHFYLVSSLYERGNLLQAARNKYYEPIEIISILYQLSMALEFLHDHKIVHRNVKPQNVLVESRHEIIRVLLSDFGLARTVRVEDTGTSGLEWTAPELLRQDYSGEAVDIWSVGVLGHNLRYSQPSACLRVGGKDDLDLRTVAWVEDMAFAYVVACFQKEKEGADPLDQQLGIMLSMQHLTRPTAADCVDAFKRIDARALGSDSDMPHLKSLATSWTSVTSKGSTKDGVEPILWHQRNIKQYVPAAPSLPSTVGLEGNDSRVPTRESSPVDGWCSIEVASTNDEVEEIVLNTIENDDYVTSISAQRARARARTLKTSSQHPWHHKSSSSLHGGEPVSSQKSDEQSVGSDQRKKHKLRQSASHTTSHAASIRHANHQVQDVHGSVGRRSTTGR